MQNDRPEQSHSNQIMMGVNEVNLNSNNRIIILPKKEEKKAPKIAILNQNMPNQKDDIEMKENVKMEKYKKWVYI